MPAKDRKTHVIVFAPATLQRQAWRALLTDQPFIDVLETSCHVEVVAPLIHPEETSVVFVDLPGLRVDIAVDLKAAVPDASLLFLVDDYDLETILPLLRAGVQGIVSRDDSVTDLARALTAAARGEMALPPAIARRALTALATGEAVGEGLAEDLTERETEVLHLLAEGMTNKDIAQTLILSVRTIEAHLRSIYGKLGVSSRTEAALWAVKHGYAAPQ